MPTRLQWQQTWHSLGIDASAIPSELYQDLVTRYSETHRHYHTTQHLDECLANFAELKSWAIQPGEIELALWFHDAVYDPARNDNEDLSADWAKAQALSSGLDTARAERIHSLILATKHREQPRHIDVRIMIDADLAILGAAPDRFRDYEKQIRQEYSVVPEKTFRLKRIEILNRFSKLPYIFNTPLFIERYELIARMNLKHALEELCGQP